MRKASTASAPDQPFVGFSRRRGYAAFIGLETFMKLRKKLPADPAASKRLRKPAATTIEHRLEEKAVAADGKVFPEPSLGKMSRAERRKLLFG